MPSTLEIPKFIPNYGGFDPTTDWDQMNMHQKTAALNHHPWAKTSDGMRVIFADPDIGVRSMAAERLPVGLCYDLEVQVRSDTYIGPRANLAGNQTGTLTMETWDILSRDVSSRVLHRLLANIKAPREIVRSLVQTIPINHLSTPGRNFAHDVEIQDIILTRMVRHKQSCHLAGYLPNISNPYPWRIVFQASTSTWLEIATKYPNTHMYDYAMQYLDVVSLLGV